MGANRKNDNNNNNNNNIKQQKQAKDNPTGKKPPYISLFSRLPNEILAKITKYLKQEHVENLKMAHQGDSELEDVFSDMHKESLESELNQLLTHVSHGEKDKAQKIIEDLTKRGVPLTRIFLYEDTVEDYSGRLIYGTALQIALGAKDVYLGPTDLQDYHKEMVEMLEEYMQKLTDGKKEIAEQKRKQFPAGWQAQEEARLNQDLIALTKVFNELANADNDSTRQSAINTFREYLRPRNKNPIQTGYHFNEEILLKALDDDFIETLMRNHPNLDREKMKLYWSQVLVEIETCLPVCFAQAIVGVEFAFGGGKPVNRMTGAEFYSRSESDSPYSSEWFQDTIKQLVERKKERMNIRLQTDETQTEEARPPTPKRQ